jgi:hypothetical protein
MSNWRRLFGFGRKKQDCVPSWKEKRKKAKQKKMDEEWLRRDLAEALSRDNLARGSTGQCGHCSRITAANVKPGEQVMPMWAAEWLNCQGFWCAKCRKVVCGECCQEEVKPHNDPICPKPGVFEVSSPVVGRAVLKKSPSEFRCPMCGGTVDWAGPHHWQA